MPGTETGIGHEVLVRVDLVEKDGGRVRPIGVVDLDAGVVLNEKLGHPIQCLGHRLAQVGFGLGIYDLFGEIVGAGPQKPDLQKAAVITQVTLPIAAITVQ